MMLIFLMWLLVFFRFVGIWLGFIYIRNRIDQSKIEPFDACRFCEFHSTLIVEKTNNFILSKWYNTKIRIE